MEQDDLVSHVSAMAASQDLNVLNSETLQSQSCAPREGDHSKFPSRRIDIAFRCNHGDSSYDTRLIQNGCVGWNVETFWHL